MTTQAPFSYSFVQPSSSYISKVLSAPGKITTLSVFGLLISFTDSVTAIGIIPPAFTSTGMVSIFLCMICLPPLYECDVNKSNHIPSGRYTFTLPLSVTSLIGDVIGATIISEPNQYSF